MKVLVTGGAGYDAAGTGKLAEHAPVREVTGHPVPVKLAPGQG